MKKNISLLQNKFSGENLLFTSDTHFFHEGIIKFCNRPFATVEEMNETLIQNWNETVPENGTVFHLGDFAFGGWRENDSEPYRFHLYFSVYGFYDEVAEIAINLHKQGITLEVNEIDSILKILRQEDMVGFRPYPDKYMNRNGVTNQYWLPHIGEVTKEVYWKIIKNTNLAVSFLRISSTNSFTETFSSDTLSLTWQTTAGCCR